MSWSTDFDKLPKTGRVIVQGRGQKCAYIYGVDVIRDNAEGFVAWHPAPEEYAPPKPKQIDFLDFGSAADLIEAVEKRTRQIVAWEAKHGGGK